MRLRMNSTLWNSLGLDDRERYLLTLSAFYLGRGVEETRELLSRGMSDPEVRFVIETAAFSGLSIHSDRITKS